MNPLDRIAEQYVELCFQVAKHDPPHVDAYYGPESLRQRADSEGLSLDDTARRASFLLAEADRLDISGLDDAAARRFCSLAGHIRSLAARVNLLRGAKMLFDEEAVALFGALPPWFPESHFRRILKQIDALLPGGGPLEDRVNALRREFIVPAGRLDAVLQAAIAEVRARTGRHIHLPANESFTVEYVSGQPWIAYNWFKGGAASVIQINTDLPVHLDFLVLIAAHEGYPGHHVFNSLREQELYRRRGWVEFSLLPLYSPTALLAEGTANYGLRMVFPSRREKTEFERERLLPLAGMDAGKIELYDRVVELYWRLRHADIEAARRYLGGRFDREQTVRWLMTFRLYAREHAETWVTFMEHYRTYIINYALGEDLVKGWVEQKHGGTRGGPPRRWERFKELLESPMQPSDLVR